MGTFQQLKINLSIFGALSRRIKKGMKRFYLLGWVFRHFGGGVWVRVSGLSNGYQDLGIVNNEELGLGLALYTPNKSGLISFF